MKHIKLTGIGAKPFPPEEARICFLVALLWTPACAASNSGASNNTASVPSSQVASADASCLAITGGTPAANFPAVWSIVSVADMTTYHSLECGGTFVSDSTLITAAHCLPCASGNPVVLATNGSYPAAADFQNGIWNIDFLRSGPQSTHWLSANPSLCAATPASGPNNGLTGADNDLAVVIFPPNTSSNYLGVASGHAEANTPVTLVGYGDDGVAANPGAYGTKRSGTNTLGPPPADGLYVVYGGGAATSAVDNEGDSGSPLLNAAGQVLGVFIDYGDAQVDGQQEGYSTFTDLSSAASQAFLQKARSQGATINTGTSVCSGG